MDPRSKKLITLHEGKRYSAYLDSLGYITIGYGFMIDARKGGRIPEKVMDYWLDVAWQEHVDALHRELPWVRELDPVRQYVLYDMTFNLGIEPFDGDGFKDWPVFVSQVESGKYAAAARNMRSTKWAKQVGQRAERLATMMETGTWPLL